MIGVPFDVLQTMVQLTFEVGGPLFKVASQFFNSTMGFIDSATNLFRMLQSTLEMLDCLRQVSQYLVHIAQRIVCNLSVVAMGRCVMGARMRAGTMMRGRT